MYGRPAGPRHAVLEDRAQDRPLGVRQARRVEFAVPLAPMFGLVSGLPYPLLVGLGRVREYRPCGTDALLRKVFVDGADADAYAGPLRHDLCEVLRADVRLLGDD